MLQLRLSLVGVGTLLSAAFVNPARPSQAWPNPDGIGCSSHV